MTKNNAALTRQLSDDMHLNLEMAKKVNVKTTQDSKDKKLKKKAKREMAFERNLDPEGFSWTHIF